MFSGKWAWWEVLLWRFMVEPLPLQVFPLREDINYDDVIGGLRIMTAELAQEDFVV